MQKNINIQEYLTDFKFSDKQKTITKQIKLNDKISYTCYINEYWTAAQRQGNALHEVSYRACFKPQLPAFFINLFTDENDIVYDPFAGRGTTLIEAGLLNRHIIMNDINPLSRIFTEARFFIPDLSDIETRLNQIPFNLTADYKVSLSAFYHPKTEDELYSLSEYLRKRAENNEEDALDKWIRMIATNRLTGHSRGFFSVYTLPPNQATSIKRQEKINAKRNQTPEYRDVKALILRKSKSLIRKVNQDEKEQLERIGKEALFLSEDARHTPQIEDESVQLTVTSPPFLDVVQYTSDNWLRCLFNNIDAEDIDKKITMARTTEKWAEVMQDVFHELYRITRPGGYVAFEVGEVRHGKIRLDEIVVPLGLNAGFTCEGVLINQQDFTKTANIWGVSNNKKGTNSNRIAVFSKT